MTREFAPRGVAELGAFFSTKTQELAQLTVELQEAHEVLENTEIRWVQHYDEIFALLEEDPKLARLPGEDQRYSIARRRGGWEAWTNYRRAERVVKRLEAACRQVDTVISACQSEAKLLRAT